MWYAGSLITSWIINEFEKQLLSSYKDNPGMNSRLQQDMNRDALPLCYDQMRYTDWLITSWIIDDSEKQLLSSYKDSPGMKSRFQQDMNRDALPLCYIPLINRVRSPYRKFWTEFFSLTLWPKRFAWAIKRGEKTRIHNLLYGPSKRG